MAAVAGYLQAKSRQGRWLLRIEDIDPPREQQGATEQIIRALELYGFEWDGDIIYQSASRAAHDQAVQKLLDAGHAYRCGCSRRQLKDVPRGPLGTIYPGTCRNGCDAAATAIRVRTTNESISFDDQLQGPRETRLETESGDFIIRRRDGLIAYQLAVVVDDEIENVSEIVRGIDLIDSTPRQIWLQRLLGFRTPAYMHVAVVTHPDGDKLSKLTGATGIPQDSVSETLVEALRALRQCPPAELAESSVADVWRWAVGNWRSDAMRGVRSIQKAP